MRSERELSQVGSKILFVVAALLMAGVAGAQTSTAPRPSLALRQTEFLLDGYRAQARTSSIVRSDIRRGWALYHDTPSATRARVFRQQAQQVSTPATTRQVDELVSGAVYQSTVSRAPGLTSALAQLDARLDQTIRLRYQLKCKEDTGLRAPTSAREALNRAKTRCTPLAQANNTIMLRKRLDAVAAPVASFETALQSGNRRQLDAAVAALALGSRDNSQMLALLAKLTTDTNSPDEERKRQLQYALAKAQQLYDAASKLCQQGDVSSCQKLPDLATEIAELTAQLQALG